MFKNNFFIMTSQQKNSKKDDANLKQSSKKNDKKNNKENGQPKKYKNPFSYKNSLQSKFVNCIMKKGKKVVAQNILRDVFDELNKKGQKNVLKSFELAIDRVTPMMEVRPKRIGGSIYQIPIEVTPKRKVTLSIRWLLQGANKKKGIPMFKRLAAEMLDAINETGFAYNKKEESHKMAQANKAFAHFAKY